MDVTNLSHYALAKGIKTSWNEMSQAQQTMLRYQYLMSVTKDKQGDFTRTQNTFANQVRLAKVNLQQLGASIGTYALPPLNKILNAFNSGSMKSIGTIATNAFKSIADIAKSTKEPLEALGRSLKNFANAAGISKLFKDLFSGVNTDTLEKVKIGINEVIYRIKQLVDFATNHVNGIKAFGSALAGVFVGVNIARKVFEIKNGMNDIIKAVNGAKKVSKGEALFETIFKMSPRAMMFVGALAIISGVAYLIIKNWSTVKEFFDKFFNQMHGGLLISATSSLLLLGAIKKFNTVSHIFNFIDKAKDKFDTLRIAGMYAMDGIKKVGSGIGTGFSKGAGLIQKLGSNLLSVGRNALTAARNIGTFIARSAMAGISKGAGLIRTLGSNMLSVGKNALTAAKNIAIMTGNVAKQGAIFIINAARALIFKGATLAVAAAQRIAATAQRILNFVMNANPIIRIITVILSLVGVLVVLYNKNAWFRNAINAIWASIKFVVGGTVTRIVTHFNSMVVWFSTLPGRLYQHGYNMFVSFKNGAWAVISGIGGWIKGKFVAFVNFFKNLPKNALQWGQDIISNLKQGIDNKVDSVVKSATSLGSKLLHAIKHVFGIASPSKEMFKIGGYLVQGLTNGITNGKDMLKSLTGKIFGGVVSFAKGIVSGGDITGWLTAALGIAGAPMSWLPALEMLTSRESGNPGTLGTGNPSLVNSIGVGNEHATGLLQLLPSTYQDMMGTNVGITNPIQNAVAGIKHIMSAWHSIYNIPGLMTGVGYKGYATGTDYADKGVAQVAENGMELIVGRQFRQFKGGEKVLNNAQTKAMLGNNGNPQVSVFVTVQGNMVGNNEYAESLGEYIYKKIVDARRKL